MNNFITQSQTQPQINDTTVDENTLSKFIVDMLNNYVKYFIKDNKNLFDGIDYEDASSTNEHLEKIYTHMEEYNLCEKIDPDRNKIYYYPEEITQDKIIELINNDIEVYEIREVQNDKTKLLCVSVSLISILIEITNLENENNENEKKYILNNCSI